jgi:predicted nucleic acid-binding protein
MTYLLDVSTLLALLWETHEFNERVTRWQENQSLAVCPITELGFLRIPRNHSSVCSRRKRGVYWANGRTRDSRFLFRAI